MTPSDRQGAGAEPDEALIAAAEAALMEAVSTPEAVEQFRRGELNRVALSAALVAAGRVLADELFADAKFHLDAAERFEADSEFTAARTARERGTTCGVAARKIERACGVPEGAGGGERG